MSDGSFVVLFKNDKRQEVFLIYRSDSPFWNLPGGGIEKGETAEEAVVRETFEETGFTIKLIKQLGTYKNIEVNTGGMWNMTYLFEGRVVSGNFTPEYDGCKGNWFEVNKLPKKLRRVDKVRIKDALTSKGKKFNKIFRPQK